MSPNSARKVLRMAALQHVICDTEMSGMDIQALLDCGIERDKKDVDASIAANKGKAKELDRRFASAAKAIDAHYHRWAPSAKAKKMDKADDTKAMKGADVTSNLLKPLPTSHSSTPPIARHESKLAD